MHIYRNILLQGANDKPFLLDAYYDHPDDTQAIALFVHGFKGFKDWGIWDLMARQFAAANCAFVKFNFSHNGTTLKQTTYHADLEAFGQNNYSFERFDIQQAINWIKTTLPPVPLYLIGHSRGGAISIVEAASRDDLAGIITWASVSRLDYAWQKPNFIEDWKQAGKYTVTNGRTGQIMPLYFQLYEDFAANQAAYDVSSAIKKLKVPVLIIHGDDDPAISHTAAHSLYAWATTTRKLSILKGANHVFGGSHPYKQPTLPNHAQKVVDTSLSFIFGT
ncbi:MAG: alpha/beta fold hydrolase [Bacteroidota bacterium]